MPTWLAFAALVVLAALYDVLTFAWHRAREARRVGRAVVVGVGMEVVGTAPFLVAFATGEWWFLAAGILGSVIGTTFGMARADPG